jgi:hypothetical protein
MKTVYNSAELMELLDIKSRATFSRKRKLGVIPKPDIDVGHPRWFIATLHKHLPGLSTNPLT